MNKLYVSSGVYPINQFGKLGKIHSVFKNSFNIKINDILINFNSKENFISSYGVFLPKNIFDEIKNALKVGNVFLINKDNFIIYDQFEAVKVDFSQEKIILDINKISLNENKLIKLLKLLDRFCIEDSIGLDLSKTVELFELMKFKELNKYHIKRIIKELTGKGKGLTPSGDDMLCGYLAILKTFENNDFYKFKENIYLEQLSTTDISKGYLKYVLDGFVSLPIKKLLDSMSFISLTGQESLVHDILNIGHTSGVDILMGVKLGLYKELNTFN